MQNLTLKIISILIAILLSMYINSESNITTADILIPVEIKELPADKVVVWQLKRHILVEVKGPSFLINRLLATPPSLKVKLPDPSLSRYSAVISRSDIDIKEPVQIISIEPPVVTFSIENKISKEVPIKLALIGQLDKGLKLVKTEIVPDKVILTGPESELKNVNYVQTVAIDLKELKADLKEETTLRIPGKLTQANTSSTKIEIVLAKLDQTKTFKNLPIEIRHGPNEHYTILDNKAEVTILGVKNDLETLDPEQIVPFVKIPKNSSHTSVFTLEVEVDTPKGFLATHVIPNKIKVKKVIGKK